MDQGKVADTLRAAVAALLVTLLAAGSPRSAVAIVPCTPSPDVINIRADIDGRSQLILQGNSVQWQHFDNAAPGREPPIDQPTFVNCQTWFPVWRDRPNRRNDSCGGCRSSVFHPDPPLPSLGQFSNLVAVSCRQSCTVVEAPNAANGFKLVIEFNDKAQSSSAGYEVNLGITPLMLSIDPFRCYAVKRAKNAPKFEPVLGVRLVDAAFGEDVMVDVTKQRDLCLPTDTNGAGILDSTTHVEGYVFKLAKGEPKQAKHTGIAVTNQLGVLVLDTGKPVSLSVPTAKGLAAPPPPLSANEVDNYECYATKISKGQPRFSNMLQVTVADQFTAVPKRFAVIKPTRLCAPVDKSGAGTKHGDNLVCYQVKPTKGRCDLGAPVNAGGGCKKESDCGGTKGMTSLCVLQPKFAKASGVFLANAFDSEQIDVVKDGELCVPSARLP